MSAISGENIQLLLRLMEASRLKFTHATLVDYHGPPGESLIGSNLMVPSGFEMASNSCDDDAPVSIRFDERRQEFGYFSPIQGWVRIDQASLQLYQPDLDRLFHALLGHNLRPLPHGVSEVEPELIWEIGSGRLTQTGLIDLWYARRIWDPTAFASLKACLLRKPSSKLRVVLTTTNHKQIPAEKINRTIIIPIGDLMDIRQQDRIDFNALKARFYNRPAELITGPIHLSEDGRKLTILGEEINFGGANQIATIRFLVGAYHENRRVNAAKTLEITAPNCRTFEQVFKTKWPSLSQYLVSRSRMWGFEF